MQNSLNFYIYKTQNSFKATQIVLVKNWYFANSNQSTYL